jgi:hypothetical protein
VPKSRVRKKKVYTPPTDLRPQPTVTSAAAARRRPSPVWLPITAVTLIVVGIAWLVVFYLTQGFADAPALAFLFKIGYWNLAIGFGAMVAALFLLARWR